MTREEIFKELNEIFIDVFGDDNIKLTDSTNADDIDEWDSLYNILINSEVQKKFGIKFTIPELQQFRNVGGMVDVIEEKLK